MGTALRSRLCLKPVYEGAFQDGEDKGIFAMGITDQCILLSSPRRASNPNFLVGQGINPMSLKSAFIVTQQELITIGCPMVFMELMLRHTNVRGMSVSNSGAKNSATSISTPTERGLPSSKLDAPEA